VLPAGAFFFVQVLQFGDITFGLITAPVLGRYVRYSHEAFFAKYFTFGTLLAIFIAARIKTDKKGAPVFPVLQFDATLRATISIENW
jgi:hypothetical protein